ncbi:MAG: linear amide C-N hydrolase [Lewinellaceae bacterium]|nr:linear amide C-N hydrolase [Lewinellaceae bacterium]
MPYHWMTDGMNEKGLFIGVATNGNPDIYNHKEGYTYSDVPAVQVIHMVRIALEKYATVEEAVSLFQSVRIWFPEEFNHLLVADASGDAAVLEWDPDKQAHVFRQNKPYLLLTNTAYPGACRRST